MSSPSRQTGFTMVELVACIVIIGVVSVVAAPRLLDNNTLAGRTYSHEIAAALREAQTLAVGSGCEVAITLNAGNYFAQQRSVTNNYCNPIGGWTVSALRADGSALAGTAPTNLTLSPATRIVFDSQGHVTSGAPPSLAISTYSLQVDPISGFVTLR